MSLQHNLSDDIHKGAYVQNGDPGAVGAKVLWIDTTSGFVLKKRNAGDTGWDTIADLNQDVLIIPIGDETTAITVGAAKYTFRMPYPFKLSAVRASLSTASSSGNPAVNIKEAGVSIFSTTITIDSGEKTSQTAATPAVISDPDLADDAEITIDIDTAGTGAKGLKITLIGHRV